MGRKRVREDEENNERERKRERCEAAAEKRLLSLELSLTNKQRGCCSFSAAFLSLSLLSSLSFCFLSVIYFSVFPPSSCWVCPSLFCSSFSTFLLLTHIKSKLHQCGSNQSMWPHVSAPSVSNHTSVVLHLCLVFFFTIFVLLDCTATKRLLSN